MIQAGDFVECVRDDRDPTGVYAVVRGNVYTVAQVGRLERTGAGWICQLCGDHSQGERVLDLAGYPIKEHFAWCACCFRPLHRPVPGAFSELLRVPVPEDA